MINPADIRLWDQQFEKWKNFGFPLNKPEEAKIPKPHPIKDHPWNESKEKYLELRGFDPRVMDENVILEAEEY